MAFIQKRRIELHPTFLGVTDDLSIEETIRIQLLNVVLVMGVIILFLLWVRTILVQETGQMLVISTVFLLVIGLLLLNINGRQKLARLITLSGLSLTMTWILIFLYPSPWELEYIFLMIIFVNLILFQGKLQILIILLVTSLFVAAHFIEPILPMEYKVLIPLTPNLPVALFVFFVLYSLITLTFYQSEIKKYENAQKETIEALQASNIKLKSVSEELEQFIYIVSSDLKSRLQKVRKSIKNVRENVNHNEYGRIGKSLEQAQGTAHQMHFWVNDILEFSRTNQLGERLEEEIFFNDLFDNLKNNLSDDINDIENRITWTDIPNVRLNKLEVVIVFYNILKVAFHEPNFDVTIKTLAEIKDDNIIIKFICSLSNEKDVVLEKENIDYKIKLCELIIKGWNGRIKIKKVEQNKIYEVNIPSDKLLIKTLHA